MNRIEQKFKLLKEKNQKALVTFISAGDPDLKTTEELIYSLDQNGVDIVELGMPFSDPMADGPVIQRSSQRALQSGTNLNKIFTTVAHVRKKTQIPILLMGYYNPILQYGEEKFFKKCASVGVDGALIVDLPPQEGKRVKEIAQVNGCSLIFLLAPTSDPERIKLVCKNASGFIYYVSLTGITGAKLQSDLQKQSALKLLKKTTQLPVCIGFGIKTAEQAKKTSQLGDGVVIGSALIEMIEKHQGKKAPQEISTWIKKIAKAVH